MSRSIHTTYKAIKGLTKIELDKQFDDPDSDLSRLVRKAALKKEVNKKRKQGKVE